MKNLILLGVTLFFPIAMLAQSSAVSGQIPVSPSKEIGVFVFPKNGQSGDQPLKDESECSSAAKQQSGIDPKAPTPIPISPE